MRLTTNRSAWLLIVSLFLLLAAACGPATPRDGGESGVETETEIETETETESSADSETAVADAPDAAGESDTAPAFPEPAAPEVTPESVDEADYITTDSGLRYYDLTAGDGDSPEEGAIVSVAYSMWLADGPVFLDSSQGQAIDFILGSEQVFAGWNEGVLTMNEGGKRQLLIPPDLALGEEGLSGIIPPDSTLILEVELVSFRPSPRPTEVAADDFETTDSGLQYYDIEIGDGLTPVEGDTVTIEFAIWLQDDLMYVAGSEDQGGAFDFAVGSGRVFPGWEEGILTMAEGGDAPVDHPA